jgi:hypothetical protein
MSELKPCPFCGAMPETDGKLVQCYLMPCDFRRFKMPVEAWNARPIEDALNKRIAELEAENIRLGIEYQRMRLALGDIAINSKRALNESPTDQLTARWRQGRQDDKWIPEVQE